MMDDELMLLQGRDVEVTYDGLIYRGRLVGADETDLYLTTLSGLFPLPLVRISGIRAAT